MNGSTGNLNGSASSRCTRPTASPGLLFSKQRQDMPPLSQPKASATTHRDLDQGSASHATNSTWNGIVGSNDRFWPPAPQILHAHVSPKRSVSPSAWGALPIQRECMQGRSCVRPTGFAYGKQSANVAKVALPGNPVSIRRSLGASGARGISVRFPRAESFAIILGVSSRRPRFLLLPWSSELSSASYSKFVSSCPLCRAV